MTALYQSKRVKELSRSSSKKCPVSGRTYSQDSSTIDFRALHSSTDSAGKLSVPEIQQQQQQHAYGECDTMESDEEMLHFDDAIDFIYGRRQHEEQERGPGLPTENTNPSVSGKRNGFVFNDPASALMQSGSHEADGASKAIAQPSVSSLTAKLEASSQEKSATEKPKKVGLDKKSALYKNDNIDVSEFTKPPSPWRLFPPIPADQQFEPPQQPSSPAKSGRSTPLSWRLGCSRRRKTDSSPPETNKLKQKTPRQHTEDGVSLNRGESVSSFFEMITRCLKKKTTPKYRPRHDMANPDHHARRISNDLSISSSSSSSLQSASSSEFSASTLVSSPSTPLSSSWRQDCTDTENPYETPLTNVSFATLSDIDRSTTSKSSVSNTLVDTSSLPASPHTTGKTHPFNRGRRHPQSRRTLQKGHSIYQHQKPQGYIRPTVSAPVIMVLEDRFNGRSSEPISPECDTGDGWDFATTRGKTGLDPAWPSQSLSSLPQSFHSCI